MLAQVIAICIFLGMFLLIILDQFERHVITLVSGALVLVLVFGLCMRSPATIWEALNLRSFFELSFWYGASEESTAGINWSTILFIAGMMIMVEGLGKAGFFRWLCLLLAKLVHYHVVPLLICFMCLSAVLSMFIDSITVVLFLATVTLELAQTMKFDPVPMILSEIFCANLGGAATMCGDPPNIIIGTSLGYTFFDFIENTGAIVAVCFAAVAVYTETSLCFGDSQCIAVCPWHIPRLQAGVGPYLHLAPGYLGYGQTFKCDFCEDIISDGRPPLCVAACPHGAQHFGPHAEMTALARRMAEERHGDLFGLQENGGTCLIYVSSVPFRDIEASLLRQGLVSAGRPSLRPAGASLERENRLVGTVLAAPLAGAALAGLRLLRDHWRDKDED